MDSVLNRTSPPTILLRELYREDGKVKKHTHFNLTKWDPKIVAGMRMLFKGSAMILKFEDAF